MNNDFFGNESISEPLYVITSVFNPYRYKSRYRLYQDFERQMLQNKNVILVTVECTFGEREAVIHSTNSRHKVVHVHSNSEIWLKENLLNIGIQSLPKKARYVATIDADITFSRPDWVAETIHLLQHNKVVQMYSEIVYLNADCEQYSKGTSLMKAWKSGVVLDKDGINAQDMSANKDCSNYGSEVSWLGAPGGAWAYTIEALQELGGLIDFAILGSGDYYMACGLLGIVEHRITNESKYHDKYKEMILEWQKNALEKIGRNVGHVKGIIFHHWHGNFKDRGYETRDEILIKNQYDPAEDIEKNEQGVIRIKKDRWMLREGIKNYFSSRNEDGLV